MGFENGNSLTIRSRRVITFCVPQKDKAAFACPSGVHPLPFRTAEVIIWSAKKCPLPGPEQKISI